MNNLESPMLSYYVSYYQKFRKVMQWTENEALSGIEQLLSWCSNLKHVAHLNNQWLAYFKKIHKSRLCRVVITKRHVAWLVARWRVLIGLSLSWPPPLLSDHIITCLDHNGQHRSTYEWRTHCYAGWCIGCRIPVWHTDAQ